MKRILIGLLASAILVATNAVAQPASSALARIKAAKVINVVPACRLRRFRADAGGERSGHQGCPGLGQ